MLRDPWCVMGVVGRVRKLNFEREIRGVLGYHPVALLELFVGHLAASVRPGAAI